MWMQIYRKKIKNSFLYEDCKEYHANTKMAGKGQVINKFRIVRSFEARNTSKN